MVRKWVILAIFLFQCEIPVLQGTGYPASEECTILNEVFKKHSDETGNPRYHRPLGVGLGYGIGLMADPLFPLLSVDYFLIPQLDAELNIGYQYSSVGGMAHLNRSESTHAITPYTGVLIGMERGTGILQIPLGVRLIIRWGLSVSFSVNEFIYLEYRRSEILFSLSAGWNFRIR